MGALEKLREEGNDEALYGLCKRFGITSQKGAKDEQEKHWVMDVLVEKGSLAPVIRYMKQSDDLAFPLRVVEQIADHDKILEIVDGLFATEPPGYVRMPERRIDLIRWFSDWKLGTDEEVLSRLTPYLVDFDENVRFSVVDGIASRTPEKIAPPLIDALLRPEEESGRIKRTIVEVLEKSKAPLGAPFPFGLLTMWVSLEAIMLSTLLLFSSNRAAASDKIHEHRHAAPRRAAPSRAEPSRAERGPVGRRSKHRRLSRAGERLRLHHPPRSDRQQVRPIG